MHTHTHRHTDVLSENYCIGRDCTLYVCAYCIFQQWTLQYFWSFDLCDWLDQLSVGKMILWVFEDYVIKDNVDNVALGSLSQDSCHWDPATTLRGSPGNKEKLCVDVSAKSLSRSVSQWLTSTTRHVSEWAFRRFQPQPSNEPHWCRVEQRQATPIGLAQITELWAK